MFDRIKQSLWGALFGALISTQAFGQATLLPNALQQYFNAQGVPVSGGSVYYYVPNTLTPKNTWSSSVESVLTQNPNPVLLNSGGYPQNGSAQPNGTYGDGSYRQIVVDQNNNTIWDLVTSSTGASSSSSGTVFAAGVPVGTILPWSATYLPTNYLYTAGQAVSRTTYALLLTAVTYQQTILCQNGIATVTVPTTVSDGTPIGAPIEAACFAPGSTVISKTSGQLTISTNATTSISVASIVFPWGNGDGATTFNIPDYRGRVPVGRDNMNSSIAGTLTSTYFGVNPDAIGAIGGNQLTTLVTGNLPPYTPSGTVATTTLLNSGTGQLVQGGTAGSVNIGGAGSGGTLVGPAPVSTSTFVGVGQGGASTSFSRVQPSTTSDYIIKALPDTTSGGLTGATNGVLFNASGFPGETNVGINGQLLLGVTGSPPQMATMSQDCTITNAGVITCLKTNNVAFAASATTDTTNAANISSGVLAVARGGSAQGTVLGARGSSGFNIDEATSTGDANYAIQSTDRLVYHTALSAARTDTLPAANSVNAGQVFALNDFAGVATASHTVTVARSGADTINGANSVVAISLQYGAALFWSDGVSRWTFLPVTSGGGTGNVASVTCGNGLLGGVITVSGTCTVDPSKLTFGGRLTLISGVPYINADTVGAQNVYYAPCAGCGGNSVPIYNGTIQQPYQFTANATDQVGQTLALGGSANWPANTIFDVFETLNGGVPVLATRAWDSSMLPSAPAQIANNVVITTGTSGSWTNSSAAFNGTPVQNSAASASIAGSANLQNCLGQDFGAGNPQAVSQIVVYAPSDNQLFGTATAYLPVITYGSSDNTNWNVVDERSLNASAIGTVYTMNVSLELVTPYRYWRTCFTGNGSNQIRVAQIQYDTTAGPSTRRLTTYNGILVNDAVVTGRISSSSTISIPQYQGSYVGTFQTDSGTAGQVSAYVTAGPSRVYNIWNNYNPADITLNAYVPVTITTPGTTQYALTNTSFNYIQNSSAYSLTILIGYARSSVSAALTRTVYMNATSAGVGYNAVIGVDSVNNTSGTWMSTVNDSAGQAQGNSGSALLTLAPFYGSHVLYGLEALAYPSAGTLNVDTNLLNSRLSASWKG